MTTRDAAQKASRAELEEIAVAAAEACDRFSARGGLIEAGELYMRLDDLRAALQGIGIPLQPKTLCE